MSYLHWIVLDLIYILGSTLYIWMVKLNSQTVVAFAKNTAWVAILFFLINGSMYFIFLTIKKTKNKSIRIYFAKLSRKIFKQHIQFGIIGAGLITVHAIWMLIKGGSYFGFFHPNLITGYFAFLLLIMTLTAGYIRRLKANGFRRKFHLIMALSFITSLFIHILI